MRTVGFSITDGGITPTVPQYAGVQGEHNATEVLFTVPSGWVSRGYAVRAEYVDGTGAFDTTGFLPIAGNLVTVPLPAAWTAAGGMGEIRLAAAELDEQGLPEQTVVYSGVAYLYFDSREGGNAAVREEMEGGLSALIADTQRAAANAQETADELRRAREQGEFDGAPFTYEDFTPEQLAELKGEPGETPALSVATAELAGVVKLAPTSTWFGSSLNEKNGTAATPRMVYEAYSRIEQMFYNHTRYNDKEEHVTDEDRAAWNGKFGSADMPKIVEAVLTALPLYNGGVS